MNKPLPVPPKQYDLCAHFGALKLTGKIPDSTEKKLPDLPSPQDHRNIFVTGFKQGLLAVNAALDNHRRSPVVPFPPAANRQTKPTAPSYAQGVPLGPPGKQSLTMQYALQPMGPDTTPVPPPPPALAPPFVTVTPRPNSAYSILSPKTVSKPPPSIVNIPAQPAIKVTAIRPRSASAPLSPTTSSPGKHTAQCSGMTRAGKQCSRRVRLPATHSHLDPTPVLYCHQHKEVIHAQIGFYVRKTASPDKFVEFSHYIPQYLQMDTQLALKVEMEKTISLADVPGYIYTFEIRGNVARTLILCELRHIGDVGSVDPKRPDVIQLKVGRAVNLNKRLDQWDKQCGSKVQIPRGWWPGTVEQDDGTGGSLLKGNIKAGDPGPFCHRVERLVHIELADLSLHTPYLSPGWPNAIPSPGALATSPPRKTIAKEITCVDCSVVHREIFAFPRPDVGRYKGKEWDLIVKPVIEKWGKFVKEYYA